MEGHLGSGKDSRYGPLDTVPVFRGEPDANAESQATRSPGGALDEGFWYRGLGEILLFEQQVSEIIDFFMAQLRKEFEAVADPKPLHNSRGSLLFMLIFAAGNAASAKTGIKIANSIKFDY